MESRFDRLEDKIDELGRDTKQLALSTAENTSSLKDHMQQTTEVRKQTEILKETCKEISDRLMSHRKEMDDELAPLKDFKSKTEYTIMLASRVGAGLFVADKMGVFDYIFKFLKH